LKEAILIPPGLGFVNRNIKHMPAVIFFAGLDLEQKASFLDGHYFSPKARGKD